MTAKRLIWILVLVLAGYVAYQYLTVGEVPGLNKVREKVADKGPRTPEEQTLDEIEKKFQALKKRYEETDVSDQELMVMRRQADQIVEKLKEIRPKITKSSDKTTIGRLSIEIRKFKDEVLGA